MAVLRYAALRLLCWAALDDAVLCHAPLKPALLCGARLCTTKLGIARLRFAWPRHLCMKFQAG
jgi:hypothetical protein